MSRCSRPCRSASPTWRGTSRSPATPTSRSQRSPRCARFARTTIAAGFGGLAQVPGLGWALGCLVVGGLFLAWRGRPWGQLAEGSGRTSAMATGAFVFVLITASGRVGFAPGIERSTRYVHVFGVLLLLVVAIAADAVMRRWRAAVPVLAAFLVASIVGNVDDFSNERPYGGDFLAAYRASFLAIPRPAGRTGASRPATRAEPGALRIGRLAAGRCGVRPHSRAGRRPARRAGCDRGAGGAAGEPTPSADRCEPVTPGTPMTLNPGSSIRMRGEGQVWVGYANATGAVGLVPFLAERSHRRLRRAVTVNVSSVLSSRERARDPERPTGDPCFRAPDVAQASRASSSDSRLSRSSRRDSSSAQLACSSGSSSRSYASYVNGPSGAVSTTGSGRACGTPADGRARS